MSLSLISLLMLVANVQAAPAREAPICAAMPGLESSISLSNTDFLLVGEVHGTTELPDAFASIVCGAIASGRSVIVGVEHTAEHQPVLTAYLDSDGGPEAREALTGAAVWETDTRFSKAMVDLLERIRGWRSAGADVSLLAFDAPADQPGVSAMREEAMAHRLLQARDRRPDSLVVALTGLGHADKEGFISASPPVRSMMMHLPPERSASLSFVRSGGENWRCARAEGAAEDVCGPAPLTPREEPLARGVHPTSDPAAFTARYSAGSLLTASPPARVNRSTGAP